MSRYRFHTLDVFTDTPFGGNPLAVVLDADGLRAGQMQAVAAEFNLSETVFVLTPAVAGSSRKRVRIFTPRVELPFAGHPTVGVAHLLAKLDLVDPAATDGLMVLEEGIGDVPVKVTRGEGGKLSTQMSVPSMPQRGPEPPARADVAAMLSLAETDLLPGQAAYSCGVPFLFVPLRDRAAMARIKLRSDLWERHLSGWWAKSIYALTTDTVARDAQIHAR
ncbi:MAG TPA: PhzF family phenazine biosynthesis protein, partial [Burkholderiales bacterium]